MFEASDRNARREFDFKERERERERIKEAGKKSSNFLSSGGRTEAYNYAIVINFGAKGGTVLRRNFVSFLAGP